VNRTVGASGGLPRFVAGKLAGGALSLFSVLVLGFFLFRMLPGDPVTTMTRGRPVSPAQLANLRRSMGLDAPLWQQLGSYLGHTLRGELGVSFEFQRPVTEVIASRLWPTLLLVGTATMLAVGLGVWFGARAGWRPGGRFDTVTTSVALALWSMPTFWLGMILLLVFSVGVGPFAGLFPTGGMRTPDGPSGMLGGGVDLLRHLALPCLTLVAVLYAQYALVMRSSLLAEHGSGYLTTARAKGLREDQVRARHAMPNALLPTLTLVLLNLGLVVGGAITVETVYSWPGLGYLTYQALNVPDFPLLHGTFLLFSVAVIGMNLLADLAYPLLDPRVRRS
jgi:peptide/nickel transport system permease protein